jgi:hypothetical protein
VAALLLLVCVLPACGGGSTGIPLPSGPGASTQTIVFVAPLPDFEQCAQVTKYFLVESDLHITSLTRVVSGSQVGIRVQPSSILGRFHAPLGCPATIAPTDGGPATVAFRVQYAAQIGGGCVQRSRADYLLFRTTGFGAASVVVDPVLRDQIWRKLDQLAVVPSLLAIPTPLPAGRCTGWTELPLP